jgi:hypothetical protein
MLSHEQLVEELMKRPGFNAEVERLEREEGALLDKQIQAHQADKRASKERIVFLSKQLANKSV